MPRFRNIEPETANDIASPYKRPNGQNNCGSPSKSRRQRIRNSSAPYGSSTASSSSRRLRRVGEECAHNGAELDVGFARLNISESIQATSPLLPPPSPSPPPPFTTPLSPPPTPPPQYTATTYEDTAIPSSPLLAKTLGPPLCRDSSPVDENRIYAPTATPPWLSSNTFPLTTPRTPPHRPTAPRNRRDCASADSYTSLAYEATHPYARPTRVLHPSRIRAYPYSHAPSSPSTSIISSGMAGVQRRARVAARASERRVRFRIPCNEEPASSASVGAGSNSGHSALLSSPISLRSPSPVPFHLPEQNETTAPPPSRSSSPHKRGSSVPLCLSSLMDPSRPKSSGPIRRARARTRIQLDLFDGYKGRGGYDGDADTDWDVYGRGCSSSAPSSAYNSGNVSTRAEEELGIGLGLSFDIALGLGPGLSFDIPIPFSSYSQPYGSTRPVREGRSHAPLLARRMAARMGTGPYAGRPNRGAARVDKEETTGNGRDKPRRPKEENRARNDGKEEGGGMATDFDILRSSVSAVAPMLGTGSSSTSNSSTASSSSGPHTPPDVAATLVRALDLDPVFGMELGGDAGLGLGNDLENFDAILPSLKYDMSGLAAFGGLGVGAQAEERVDTDTGAGSSTSDSMTGFRTGGATVPRPGRINGQASCALQTPPLEIPRPYFGHSRWTTNPAPPGAAAASHTHPIDREEHNLVERLAYMSVSGHGAQKSA